METGLKRAISARWIGKALDYCSQLCEQDRNNFVSSAVRTDTFALISIRGDPQRTGATEPLEQRRTQEMPIADRDTAVARAVLLKAHPGASDH